MTQTTFLPDYFLFNRIEVCGKYIPSEKSITSILSEIDNESDRIQFVRTNNIIVWMFEHDDPEDSDDLKLRQLIIELIQNYQKTSGVIGENEAKLIQSLVLVNWFAVMVAKMKEGNIQDLRKMFSSHHAYFKKAEIIELDNPEKNYTPRYSNLKKGFPEYAKATQFLVLPNLLCLIND
jgi:hypothetical protein